jgi:hypothetical protein
LNLSIGCRDSALRWFRQRTYEGNGGLPPT